VASSLKSSPPVSITFLGGLREIGRNSALIEQEGKAVLVDFGVLFPRPDMPGVDVVLPDFRFLRSNIPELVGVVLTHGHEDHIGGLPFLLREFPVPVYGSRATLAFVESKLSGVGGLGEIHLRETPDYSRWAVGPFEVEFIPVTHSIPGATAVAVTTAQGIIFHTGDFKVDLTPVDGRAMGLARMAELGREPGIRVLLSDSTNADESGHSESESSVGPKLATVFAQHRGKRLTVACFASHIHRISQIVACALREERRVYLCGRSLKRTVGIAVELGLMDASTVETFGDVEEVASADPSRTCVIATGSQGEAQAGLHSLAFRPERWYGLGEADVVVFSSDVIPGNEASVGRLVNQMLRQGAQVIYPAVMRVHSSGHGKSTELQTVAQLVQPEYFIPVHGEFRQLLAHAHLVQNARAASSGVLVCEDGHKVTLSEKGAVLDKTSDGEYLYVDGAMGDVSRGVLRERRELSNDGIVVVAVVLDQQRHSLRGDPELFSLGWVHDEGEEALLDKLRERVKLSCVDNSLSGKDAQEKIRRDVTRFVKSETKRRPYVLVLLSEV